MFQKKAKNKANNRNVEVKLEGRVLFSGNLEDLPLKEEWIIQKSVEFFNDPEPCFIHRGAVAVRLLNEIWDSAGNSGAEFAYADFPAGSVIRIHTNPEKL